MGVLNKSCVPLIRDCCLELIFSRQPGPSLEGGEGPGPAVHTGPAEAPGLSCRCPAAGPRKEVPGTRPGVGREFVLCLAFRRNVPTAFNVRVLTKRELCKHTHPRKVTKRPREAGGGGTQAGCPRGHAHGERARPRAFPAFLPDPRSRDRFYGLDFRKKSQIVR